MWWQAATLHAPVRAVLAAGLAGTVLSAHRRAVNLRFGDRLVGLVAPEIGDGPGLVVLAGTGATPVPGWAPGETVHCEGGVLLGPRGAWVAWSDALDWAPPPAPARVPVEQLPEAAAWLAASLRAAAGRPSGLGDLARSRWTRAVAGMATARMEALREAVRRTDGPEAAAGLGRAVEGLVGLGPGLTPSGDDLLAGFVFALSRGGHPAAAPLRRAVEEALTGDRTTPLSAHFLRWAARGVAMDDGVRLVDALLTGAVADRAAALAAVLRHGATSGADWALGVWLALDLMSDGG